MKKEQLTKGVELGKKIDDLSEIVRKIKEFATGEKESIRDPGKMLPVKVSGFSVHYGDTDKKYFPIVGEHIVGKTFLNMLLAHYQGELDKVTKEFEAI